MFFNVSDKVKLSELALAFYPDYKNKVFEVCNVSHQGGLDIYRLKGVETIFFETELMLYSKASKLIPEIDMDVKSPKHYKLEGLELEGKDIIRSVLGKEGYKNWCRGTALKYLLRAGKKEDELKDYKKAKEYISWIIEEMNE